MKLRDQLLILTFTSVFTSLVSLATLITTTHAGNQIEELVKIAEIKSDLTDLFIEMRQINNKLRKAEEVQS